MEIQWLDDIRSNTIYFHPRTLDNYALTSDSIILEIGSFKKELYIRTSYNMKRNCIGLPDTLTDDYTIPTDIPYEVKIDRDSIRLGPVIAIIIQEYYRGISEMILDVNSDRFEDYFDIKGLIYVCHSSRIDLENKTIEGYCYTGNGDGDHKWRKGTFPYPHVVFNRNKKLNDSIFHSLQSEVGDNLFNSDFVDKWKQYNLFSNSSIIEESLPHTVLLTSSDDLKRMLNRYGSVYMKPHSRANGEGIIYVEKKDNGYLFKNTDNKYMFCKTKKGVLKLLRSINARGNYIIQQPVPFRVGNRNVDFRFYMQKNENEEWTSPGFSTKIGKENSINTNYDNRGYLVEGGLALKYLYKMDDEEVEETKKQMFSICKEACQLIEDEGIHIGDVAFDLIVDSDYHIWLLELQIRYGVEDELPWDIYYRLMTTPLKYAKALAGF